MASPGPEPAGHERREVTSPKGGTGWTPSRGFWLGLAVVLLFALVLVSAGALAAARGPQGVVRPQSSPIPVEVTVVPPKVTPDPDFSRPIGDPEPQAAAVETAAPVSSSIVQSPATIASSWSAGPQPAPAGPASALQPGAGALAQQAAERFGVRIVLEGQDWGPDGLSQEANIGAVISAMDRLPLRVTSSVIAHPHGPLTFVSNQQGRTADGWQPYGGFPIAFYTNSDQGPAGHRPANEVVLITGSSDLSIAHEVLHAYSFREVGLDRYVLALLGDEMRSFMAATGWRLLSSEEEVRNSWDGTDLLFQYEGPPVWQFLSRQEPVEDYANSFALFFYDPATLKRVSPDRYEWFLRHAATDGG